MDTPCQSLPVERSPELYFALRERHQQGDEHHQGWRAAMLFVYAHRVGETATPTPHVSAGIYLEKGDGGTQFGPVDDLWDWPFFAAALGNAHVREELGSENK